MSRLALAALTAVTLLAGCEERRIVYRDHDGRDRRYGSSDSDERYSRRGSGKVVCDDRVCYKDGQPDRYSTRQVYGKGAVRGGWW